jgi:hypothetical protein
MSNELADSIVLAAHKMERNEVEVISFIRYHGLNSYSIVCPVRQEFSSFEEAYNYLAMKGYRKVSSDINTDFKKLLELDKKYPVVMVMSKKVKKE